MHEADNAQSPYFVARCARGCYHLVWNSVTLHLTEDDFLMLASIVNSALDRVHRERCADSAAEHVCADSPIM